LTFSPFLFISLTHACWALVSGAGVGVGVGVAVDVDVGVAVGVTAGAAVGVEVGVPTGVAVGVDVGVAVIVDVAVGVAVGVTVGAVVAVLQTPASAVPAYSIPRSPLLMARPVIERSSSPSLKELQVLPLSVEANTPSALVPT
jgi:hypothetical protein